MTGRPADPGLDTDLATLERCTGPQTEGRAALRRVEAELARLREGRDAAKSAVKFCPYCAGAFVPETACYEGPCAGCKRAEAAEARCAAMEECDCIPFAFSSKACPKCGRRGVVSDKTVSQFLIERNEFEARCARLQQALGELRSALARERGGGTPLSRSEYIELHRSSGELLHRREALAGPDTPAVTIDAPADAPKHGSFYTPADSRETCEICGEPGNLDYRGWHEEGSPMSTCDRPLCLPPADSREDKT